MYVTDGLIMNRATSGPKFVLHLNSWIFVDMDGVVLNVVLQG